MPLIITDDDAERLLSIPEAVEAMRTAFRDFADGRAANPPRLRYSIATPDAARKYTANIHAGAVQSMNVACVRAGSDFGPAQDDPARKAMLRAPVNWSIVTLYDLSTGEPLAFMHETYLSGLRVGATNALAVDAAARADAKVLGLFGSGNQALPSARAIGAVRPIRQVRVFSPNREHREGFAARMRAAGESVEVIACDDPLAVVRGADIICCCTNSRQPVFDGAWLEGGQMVISIGNSDVLRERHEVDRNVFARASDILINDWESVTANRQVELLRPMEEGAVEREDVHTLGDVVAGKAKLRARARGGAAGDGIVYYKNNSGLAIQFAACGAIIHRKLLAEGTNRTIPSEWFAGRKYHL